MAEEVKFDRGTVMFVLYLLYKMNYINRDAIRSVLKILSTEKVPEDIIAYLVAESRK